jgi:hypothetical protein
MNEDDFYENLSNNKNVNATLEPFFTNDYWMLVFAFINFNKQG